MRAALGGLISSNNNNNNGGSSSLSDSHHHHPVEADTTTSANLTSTSTNSSSSSSLFNGAADLFRSTSSLSLNLSFSSSSSSSASSQQQPPQQSQSSLPQPSTTSSKMLKTPLKAFHSILPTPTNSGAPSLTPNPPLATAPTSTNAAAASTAATSSAATPPPPATTTTTTTTTTGPAPITADVSSLLNKSATGSTGIYQQSVFLRSQLQRIPAFSPFFQFSISGSRATKDVVHQLWETFSLGKPLCVLFNLQDIPTEFKIVEYADEEVDPDPLRKERQRAIALFIMGVNNLKMNGKWGSDAPLFSISELVGDAMDTNGFVKVVATVIHLLSRFPSTVWAEDGPSAATVHGQGNGGNATANANANNAAATATAPTSSKDVERRNLVRELIETERKYCQDLEIMQIR
ncbi:hypothetical protein FRC19_006096 [Serendipita sp. 401]|nr:hypothetical protein FRC19_006096 [Serendipita sp. 401]